MAWVLFAFTNKQLADIKLKSTAWIKRRSTRKLKRLIFLICENIKRTVNNFYKNSKCLLYFYFLSQTMKIGKSAWTSSILYNRLTIHDKTCIAVTHSYNLVPHRQSHEFLQSQKNIFYHGKQIPINPFLPFIFTSKTIF